jgi:endonuclease/exonuclease/phosphatase family metal-dependent hydrolase
MQSNGYDVQLATDSAMTQNLETYSIRTVGNAAQQFTPGDLTYGQNYYWRVRGWNSATTSSWTAPVSGKAANHMYLLRLMTYNLLNRNSDGQMGSCGIPYAPWASRKAQAAAVVGSYKPDIIGLQEGGQAGGTATTQAQDLAAAIQYRLAGTGPDDPKVSWAGNYIAYNPAVYRTVGSGGHWNLDSTGVSDYFDAVYQEFQPLSGPAANILVVDTHMPPDVSSFADQLRYTMTTTVIQKANALAAQLGGIPVVYTGDFNSFPGPGWHPFDAPPVAMSNAGIPSDASIARMQWNGQYASRNKYCVTPPADGTNLDYLYIGPGVAGGSWGIVLKLNSSNQFNLPIPSDHNPVAGTLKIPY